LCIAPVNVCNDEEGPHFIAGVRVSQVARSVRSPEV
jgi:hypothetical protein